MLKIFGAILIIFASTKIGFLFASRLETRKNSLINLKNAFSLLESEISFSKNYPSKAFENIAHLSLAPVSSFFDDVHKAIDISKKSTQSAWSECVEEYGPKMCLTRIDMQVLTDFSSRFGKSDVENELKNIYNTSASLDMQIADAGRACDTNKKMYQSAGLLGGILVAILLF